MTKNHIVKFAYAGKRAKFTVPSSRLAGVLASRTLPQSKQSLILRKALENPLHANVLEQWIKKDDPLLIIVNDTTRQTPTVAILEIIAPIIRHARLEFLMATGTHRSPIELELRFILGSFYQSHRSSIYVHDCQNQEDLEFIGTTTLGTEVHINRHVKNASKILVIGSVEPHYFAGFTGGRKGLVPGVAGFKTIEQNHSHAMSDQSQPMKLTGNPVHEDMIEAVRFLKDKDIYAIQTVLDSEGWIYAAFTGNLHMSFDAAAEKAADLYGVPIKQKADIVVAVATPPLDCNLYQSQKAMEHARLAVNPDGILILVSACHEGLGPDAFYKLLTSHRDPDVVLKTIHQGYRLGHHKAAKWISLSRQVSLFSVTELDPDLMRKIYMLPFETVQHAVDRALRERPGQVLVMPSASVTVPILK